MFQKRTRPSRYSSQSRVPSSMFHEIVNINQEDVITVRWPLSRLVRFFGTARSRMKSASAAASIPHWYGKHIRQWEREANMTCVLFSLRLQRPISSPRYIQLEAWEMRTRLVWSGKHAQDRPDSWASDIHSLARDIILSTKYVYLYQAV